jgi:hypothetical protein
MRNILWKYSYVAALTVGVLILIAPPAHAQGSCVPISGTIYGWNIDSWQMMGDFTIAREVRHGTISVVGTSLIGDPLTMDVWQGTETWTLDFGDDNTIQLRVRFVTEHANIVANTSGIFHYATVGTFANGTGVFKHAYGNLSAQGPFGPTVKLPETIPAPEDAWYTVLPSQGMICGLNNRDK